MSEFDFPLVPAKTYAVGQRVRILSVLGGPAARMIWNGREGIITGIGIMAGTFFGQAGYFVDVRGLGQLQLASCQIELIIPEGHRPVSWHDCLWCPDDI